MTGVVRTVLGDVAPENLGTVDMHDHLIIRGARDPELRIDSIDDAVAEAEAFRAAGGGTIVDAMPSSAGGDWRALAEVSRRTGVHVVATAGFHKVEYYDGCSPSVEVLLAECREGIDESASRPGLLKVATGFNAVRPFERHAIEVVGEVQRATGLPLITHADHGTYALEQLDLLGEHGVRASRVAISHLDRNPDPGYHVAVLERGAYAIYDGVGRENYRPVSAVASCVTAIVEAGYGERLLLGADIAKRSLRRCAGAIGSAGLLDSFVPGLVRGGAPEDVLAAALGVNAARFLTLDEGGRA